jgi:hypothetical protein
VTVFSPVKSTYDPRELKIDRNDESNDQLYDLYLLSNNYVNDFVEIRTNDGCDDIDYKFRKIYLEKRSPLTASDFYKRSAFC